MYLVSWVFILTHFTIIPILHLEAVEILYLEAICISKAFVYTLYIVMFYTCEPNQIKNPDVISM